MTKLNKVATKQKYNWSLCNLVANIGSSYRNDPKFSDRKVWANSADPDQTAPLRLLLEEQSDQGLHCLLIHLHLLDKIFYGLVSVFEF